MASCSAFEARRRRALATWAVVLLGGAWVGAQGTSTSRIDRVAAYVEQYYGRAQSLMAEETVTLEHLRSDLSSDGPGRRLVYEMRMEWDPTAAEPKASVLRQLLRVGGRPAKPGAKPECLDPKGISPEPLAFLLPDRLHRFVFREVGRGRAAEQEAVTIDYRPAREEAPTITGDKECITIDMPMRTRGRLWVQPETHAILRLDEYVVGMTDVRIPRSLQSVSGWGLYVTVERSDTTTRYAPIRFTDPDETVLLPVQVQAVSVIRASGIQRLRVTQTYKNYRRFITGSRVLEAPAPGGQP
ncbi:MAG TPA: hypothetical protein VIY56_18190 [Vicinamibacterales bacterium]